MGEVGHGSELFSQALATLVVTVVLIAAFRRVGIPQIIGYLCVGLIVRQFGMEFFAQDSEIHFIAEFGVVFLLFTLGLEFSLPRMLAMRRLVFGLGLMQVVFTTLIFTLLAKLVLVSWSEAFIVAAALTLSSTAILTKLLSEKREFHSRHGLLIISTLLFQDLAAIPFLILVPALASAGGMELATTMSWSLVKGGFALFILLGIGQWILPPLFHEIASARNEELFVLFSLLVALFAAWLTHLLGLSMALGAFLAGMTLGESQFRHQVEAEIRPFRDILLGLFFITVGTLLDVTSLVHSWKAVLLALAAFMTLKFSIIFLLARLMGEKKTTSIQTALMLSQASEFGFVVIALAVGHALLSHELATIVIAASILSMALTPLLAKLGTEVAKKWSRKEEATHDASGQDIKAASAQLQDHVIVCGFGRVGQTICRFLRRENIPSIALDLDPMRIQDAATAGENIFYGDSRKLSILQSAGLESARLLVITFDDYEDAKQILCETRRMRSDLPVLIRTQDDARLEELQKLGATEVVPESLEGSLMLVAHVLVLLKVPVMRVLNQVQQARKDRYQLLHGFFHGERSDVSQASEPGRKKLHSVYLTETASAVNKTVSQLNFDDLQVSVVSVRRDDQEFIPDENFQFRDEDVLILSGDPDNIEDAESRLLRG